MLIREIDNTIKLLVNLIYDIITSSFSLRLYFKIVIGIQFTESDMHINSY